MEFKTGFSWREPKMYSQSPLLSQMNKSAHVRNEEKPQQQSVTNREREAPPSPWVGKGLA